MNETTKKYKVLTFTNLADLEEQVNLHIEEGWKSTGGITVYNDLYTRYAQAMIKEPPATTSTKKASASSKATAASKSE